MQTRAGRHPLLVPFVRKAVLEAVARGAPVALAAQSAGIAPRTLDRAMSLARAGDPRYVALLDEMATARAARAVRALSVIEQAAEGGQWQAAAWYLERSDPDEWGRRERQDVRVSGTLDVASAEQRLAELVGVTLVAQLAQGDEEEG